MMSETLLGLLTTSIDLARLAGAAIMQVYAGAFEVQHKADRSPLTEADMAAHHIILAGLQALTPDLPVLSEESAAVPYAERSRWIRYWLVDPLDGTREFVKRNGEFTVNIALIEDGHPRLGVVYAPARDELTYAAEGFGTLVERAGGAPQRARVAPRSDGPLRIAGSRSHYAPRTDEFLQRLGTHELICLGSSLKFCLLAEGGADLYVRYGPTSEWDTAAGQCVLEEAGGSVTDFFGAPLTYNRRDSLINPDFLASADPSRDWRPLL
jgi:3'(2'), 5'-bisphosphate nucleotidase